MPSPSKIKQLPEPDRKWLESLLIENNFANYDILANALAERGYEISRASVGRFGKEFKEHCERVKQSTEMAIILAEQLGDDENAIGDAAVRTMQSELYQAMADYDWGRIKQMDPNELSLSVARLSRAGVNQKKWQAEVRERIRQVADEVGEMAREGGLSVEAVNEVRTKILGIPALP